MREKIYLLGSKYQNQNELLLEVEAETELRDMEAVGQMLVDSADFSFTYLLEKNNEYTYLMIKEDDWPALKKAVDNGANVSLTNGTDQLILEDFCEELHYLIDNIKGNSNYGEEMVEKVEAHFY